MHHARTAAFALATGLLIAAPAPALAAAAHPAGHHHHHHGPSIAAQKKKLRKGIAKEAAAQKAVGKKIHGSKKLAAADKPILLKDYVKPKQIHALYLSVKHAHHASGLKAVSKKLAGDVLFTKTSRSILEAFGELNSGEATILELGGGLLQVTDALISEKKNDAQAQQDEARCQNDLNQAGEGGLAIHASLVKALKSGKARNVNVALGKAESKKIALLGDLNDANSVLGALEALAAP